MNVSVEASVKTFMEDMEAFMEVTSMDTSTTSMNAFVETRTKAYIEAMEASMEAMEVFTEAFMNFHQKCR